MKTPSVPAPKGRYRNITRSRQVVLCLTHNTRIALWRSGQKPRRAGDTRALEGYVEVVEGNNYVHMLGAVIAIERCQAYAFKARVEFTVSRRPPKERDRAAIHVERAELQALLRWATAGESEGKRSRLSLGDV